MASELEQLGVVERQHTSFREELAWAAGFFDGEGCTLTRTGHSRVRDYPIPACSITQNDREVLDRFAAAVSAGGVHPRANGTWAWSTRNWREGQAVVAMLWPFLGTLKRRQATRALLRWKAHVATGRWRIVECANGHDWTNPANVYEWPGNTRFGPRRICRPCQRDRLRRRKGTP